MNIDGIVDKFETTFRKIPSKALVGVGCLVVGLLMGRYVLPRGFKPKKELIRASNEKNVFVLLVTITFPNVDEKNRFKKLFEPMAKYVAEKELTTVSYEVAESDKDERQVVVIERYADRKAYSEIHRNSAVFKEYKQRMKELDREGKMIIHGHSYYETNIGFV